MKTIILIIFITLLTITIGYSQDTISGGVSFFGIKINHVKSPAFLTDVSGTNITDVNGASISTIP